MACCVVIAGLIAGLIGFFGLRKNNNKALEWRLNTNEQKEKQHD